MFYDCTSFICCASIVMEGRLDFTLQTPYQAAPANPQTQGASIIQAVLDHPVFFFPSPGTPTLNETMGPVASPSHSISFERTHSTALTG